MSIAGRIGPQDGRSDWKTIRSIPNDKFGRILAQHVKRSTDLGPTKYRLVATFTGAYNHVRIFEMRSGEHTKSYAVKVPGVGTTERWQKQDADMLRSQYGTMKLVREKTKCPVPEVIAYDDSIDNELGAPFILMKACPGTTANNIWFDANEQNQDDVENVDSASDHRLAMRNKFLESLARAMSELRTLEFDKIGALHFQSPGNDPSYEIGSCWQENMSYATTKEDLTTTKVPKEQPVCESSHALFGTAFRARYPHNQLKVRSEHIIDETLEEVYRCQPFTTSARSGDAKETFVLRHDDLGFQNILCDRNTGEVTAIIDWDRCVTAPRCIDFASLPTFLILDWFPPSSYPVALKQPELLNKYREVYAETMMAATGTGGDGRYTAKSALYQATYAAIHGSSIGESKNRPVQQIMGMILNLPEVHHDDWLNWSEKNWAKYEKVVKEGLARVIAPDGMGAVDQ